MIVVKNQCGINDFGKKQVSSGYILKADHRRLSRCGACSRKYREASHWDEGC